MIVVLRSPDGSRNVRDLSNEATVRVRDELARLPGVADVTYHGCVDCSVRVRLDAEKMAARKLTAGDVVAALQQQNVQAAAGQTGQPATPPRKGFQITITGPRLSDPEQLREIGADADANGRVVRLKDVAGVEAESGAEGSQALLNGKPVVALAVGLLPGARPQDVSAAVRRKLAELRPSLVKGVDADASFDFTAKPEPAERTATPQYLLLDLLESGGASAERTRKALTPARRCCTMLRECRTCLLCPRILSMPFLLGPASWSAWRPPARRRPAGRKSSRPSATGLLPWRRRPCGCATCRRRAVSAEAVFRSGWSSRTAAWNKGIWESWPAGSPGGCGKAGS